MDQGMNSWQSGYGNYEDKSFGAYLQESNWSRQDQEESFSRYMENSSTSSCDKLNLMVELIEERENSKKLQELNDKLIERIKESTAWTKKMQGDLDKLQEQVDMSNIEKSCSCEAKTQQLESRLSHMQGMLELVLERIPTTLFQEVKSPWEKEMKKHFEKETTMWNKHLKAQERIHQRCIDQGNKLSHLEYTLDYKLAKLTSMVNDACLHIPKGVRETSPVDDNKCGGIRGELKSEERTRQPQGDSVVDIEEFLKELEGRCNEETTRGVGESSKALSEEVDKDDEVIQCVSVSLKEELSNSTNDIKRKGELVQEDSRQESSSTSEVKSSTTPMDEKVSQEPKVDEMIERKRFKKRKRKEKREKAKIETKGLKERVRILEELVFKFLNGDKSSNAPSLSEEGENSHKAKQQRVYDPP